MEWINNWHLCQVERLRGVPGCSRACPSRSCLKEMSIFCPCSDFAILWLDLAQVGWNWSWPATHLLFSLSKRGINYMCLIVLLVSCWKNGFPPVRTAVSRTQPGSCPLPPGAQAPSPVKAGNTWSQLASSGGGEAISARSSVKIASPFLPSSDLHHEWPLAMKIPVNFIGHKTRCILFENQKRQEKMLWDH